uniref:2OG-Fe(II) oxygenase n=1 Tax=Parerythrobacter lutipelagi TaxID=1964208 RepID=UPI0010F7CE95|nr:2OG-Fe(II) oxygenase [Parerythrobacter lutipelagi]
MLPRHATFDDLLSASDASALLDNVLGQECAFSASQVTSAEGHTVDLGHRNAASLDIDWNAEGSAFRAAVRNTLPAIFEATGIRPFSPVTLELECVAHRDGGKFGTHIDTLTDTQRQDSDRIVSAVYYFYREPKPFSGGELALHAIGEDESIHVEPRHNRLVAFPSFAPHEVMPVTVPGNAFPDARFSINCWLRRKRG